MINLKELTQTLLNAGAKDVVMVGGCVRDKLLGVESKDIDIEVYGLSYSEMARALEGRFPLNQVGQSFSVLKVGNEIDLALPRRDSKIGDGHKGFEVVPDSSMTFAQAASRRDLTINAIGMRIDGTLCDPFDGAGDLKRGILRAPSEAFCEDPLRVLRAMQFAARFGFVMEERTIELCRRVLPEFKTLSSERVYGEWTKWATKGVYPDKGLDLLEQTDWITCFPELNALRGVEQNPKWHPEGDVFVHTKLVCAQAAKIAVEQNLNETDRTILLFAALCHDFGKPIVYAENAPGDVSTPNHAKRGADAVESFLSNMRAPIWLMENVIPLCKTHMFALGLPDAQQPTDRNVRRLAEQLEPSNIVMWTRLVQADILGRGEGATAVVPFLGNWLEKAEELKVAQSKPEPILQGRDIIPLGVKPGPGMGKILNQAWEAQLDGEFIDLPGAIEWFKRQQS